MVCSFGFVKPSKDATFHLLCVGTAWIERNYLLQKFPSGQTVSTTFDKDMITAGSMPYVTCMPADGGIYVE